MIPAATVGGPAHRLAQVLADKGKVEGVEDRSVMKEVSTFALLGVAGDFSAFHDDVASPRQFQARNRNGLDDTIQNIGIGSVQVLQAGVSGEGEHQAEAKATL